MTRKWFCNASPQHHSFMLKPLAIFHKESLVFSCPLRGSEPNSVSGVFISPTNNLQDVIRRYHVILVRFKLGHHLVKNALLTWEG